MQAQVTVDWETVYRRCYPSVYRALVATLFDGDDAADALHEAFLSGLKRPPSELGNMSGWLYRVALRRARRQRQRGPLPRPLLGAEIIPAPTDEIAVLVARLSVMQLLSVLTPRQRSIVVAYFYLDQSQEQIAELLGIRRGTVAATIAQALARMRKGDERV
jgi:RNA polymerase sigma factor (sigma-70 family)